MTHNRERTNRHDPPERRPEPSAGGAGVGNLAGLRREARDLLAAGEAAISRALSGDSEEFLRANRQQGGQ